MESMFNYQSKHVIHSAVVCVNVEMFLLTGRILIGGGVYSKNFSSIYEKVEYRGFFFYVSLPKIRVEKSQEKHCFSI